jgi:integrase
VPDRSGSAQLVAPDGRAVRERLRIGASVAGPVSSGGRVTEGGHHGDLYIGEHTMEPIFLGVEGGRVDRYCADRMVKRSVKRAEIDKRISPHSLRHSFTTAALDAGVPLRDVQEVASHARRDGRGLRAVE